MFWAKFSSSSLGSFWLEVQTGNFENGLAFSQGLAFGSLLVGEELCLLDTRLSKHPSEKSFTRSELLELFNSR